MTRLDNFLDPDARRALSIELAGIVHDAVSRAGLDTVIVSDDEEVRTWAAHRRAACAEDSGAGLDASVAAVVSSLQTPWAVFHADLPLITHNSVALVAHEIADGRPVVCPSLDGGTNVIAGFGPFDFSYGPGSFTRHLAMLPGATVLVDPALAIDVDTAAHYLALSRLGHPSSVAG